jgi:transcriptional regulator with XRE-family HTH domain
MTLKDELKRLGVSQGDLADALGKSRATINRMKDAEVTDEVMEVLQGLSVVPKVEVEVPLAEKVKDWEKYSLDEIRELCKRRGGLEGLDSSEKRIAAKNCRMVEGGELVALETDYEIAHSIGLRVFEFHRMVDKLRRAS